MERISIRLIGEDATFTLPWYELACIRSGGVSYASGFQQYIFVIWNDQGMEEEQATKKQKLRETDVVMLAGVSTLEGIYQPHGLKARGVARKGIINRGILLLCRRQHSGWVKYEAKIMGDAQVPAEVRDIDREVVQLQFQDELSQRGVHITTRSPRIDVRRYPHRSFGRSPTAATAAASRTVHPQRPQGTGSSTRSPSNTYPSRTYPPSTSSSSTFSSSEARYQR